MFRQKYRKMRRRQEEGMADAPHNHHSNPHTSNHIEYVSFNFFFMV